MCVDGSQKTDAAIRSVWYTVFSERHGRTDRLTGGREGAVCVLVRVVVCICVWKCTCVCVCIELPVTESIDSSHGPPPSLSSMLAIHLPSNFM